MLDVLPRTMFALLAGSPTMKTLASRYGMRKPSGFARRFIAGEDLAEAIEAARAIEQSGLKVTLDFLGESVSARDAAAAATRAYVQMIGEISLAGIDRNLSIKLTQVGLDVDRATCTDNLRRVLDAASQNDFFVRIDMENTPYTGATLDIFETMVSMGYRNTGVVIQSCLRRSAADVQRVNKLGGRIRLVKGAYRESRELAFQQKKEVDAAFVELMRVLLREGNYPAIATHDQAMIDATLAFAHGQNILKGAFEFQMLYGIRRDLQASLVSEGYPVRVYVPFGADWFPYFMRRLGERPANVGFVVRSLLAE